MVTTRFLNAALSTFVVAALAACSPASASSDGLAIAVDDGIKWGPAPAIFPPGAKMAVLQGDPSTNALFTVRLRLPNGYRIAPHTHPTDEHVTVIQGTFRVGMGTRFVADSLIALPAGRFVTAPANHPHYAEAQGVTVVQVHAMGPFALTYVNPADVPKVGEAR